MLTLTHATERDIDMLFIEELDASPDFANFILQKACSDTNVQIATQNVFHSVRRTHNRREIDIQLSAMCTEGRRHAILIENKLDTTAQAGQAQSYRDEASLLLARGEADVAKTMLICPAAWPLSDPNFAKAFDTVLTYEAAKDYLASRIRSMGGELGARLAHRVAMLDQAVTKARRGYQAVAMPVITDFNAAYVSIMKEAKLKIVAGPNMLKAGRPGESKTMIFDPSNLPNWPFLPQMRLVHQLREGNANLNFYKWGDHFSKLAAQVAIDIAGTGWRPVPTTNKRAGGSASLMLVADTPFIDNLQPLDDQQDAVIAGLQAVSSLKDWLWNNRAKIEAWSRLARS
jgi:hypothetical protein